MRRREFITLFGGAAATWPLAARSQQPAMPVIGYLYSGAPQMSANVVVALQTTMSEEPKSSSLVRPSSTTPVSMYWSPSRSPKR
jgi:hypothetical protein